MSTYNIRTDPGSTSTTTVHTLSSLSPVLGELCPTFSESSSRRAAALLSRSSVTYDVNPATSSTPRSSRRDARSLNTPCTKMSSATGTKSPYKMLRVPCCILQWNVVAVVLPPTIIMNFLTHKNFVSCDEGNQLNVISNSVDLLPEIGVTL